MKTLHILLLSLALNVSQMLPAQTILWAKKSHPNNLQVNGVAFTPDGQRILSGTNCHPAKIRLFNTSDGSLAWDYTVSNSLECMMGVGLSSNEKYLAAAEETGNLMLFDYSQNPPTLSKVIDLGTTYAFSVDFAPNSEKVAIGASSGKLRTFNLPDGSADLNLTAHAGGYVTTVDYAPGGTKIATGGSDNKVKIWDAAGQLLLTLNGHTSDLTAVKFTPDGQRLISGARDSQVKIWDATTGTLLHSIGGSIALVNGLDISPDGQFIAAVYQDKLVKIWRTSDYELVASFSTGSYGIGIAVAWSPVADQIAIGTSTSDVVLYDVAATVPTKIPTEAAGEISVFPNPSNTGRVTVSSQSGQQPVQRVRVLDLQGRVVRAVENQQLTSVQVDLSDLPAGTWWLEVQTARGTSCHKVLRSESW